MVEGDIEFIRKTGKCRFSTAMLSLTLEGPYEVMTHLFHDLGIQSNILVSAKYSHTGSKLLTPAKVSAALEALVHEHPALSIIAITRPSEKKKRNNRLWEARLPSIAMQDCVDFLDNQPEGDEALSNIYEDVHNQWFDAHETTKPWWRLVIVNGKYAVFVYHHSIGDGLSGYAFHRSLLAALNERESSPLDETVVTTIFRVPKTSPPPYPLDLIDDKFSWRRGVTQLLLWHTIRLFINQKHFLFSDATFSKSYPTARKPLPIEERTVTRVQTLRIKETEMNKCLEACHQHHTTFTALLHTLILVTLATDIYPKAKLGFSRIAVNIRQLLRVDPGRDVFVNAASQNARKQFLGKYRAAGRHMSSEQPQTVQVDAPAVWKLAKKYKEDFNRSWKSRKPLQDFLTGKLLGQDDEEVGTFYGLGLYQNNGFLISNLGPFEPKHDMANGGWSITNVGFSAGEIRASLGDAGIIFNVSSVKNRDCLVVATYEEGVLAAETVRKVLGAIMERLKILL